MPVECFQEHVLAQYLWRKEAVSRAGRLDSGQEYRLAFSFENICETLQLNPDYIRRGLLVWKEARRKTHSAKANGGANGQPA
jgi:hypothetical protein